MQRKLQGAAIFRDELQDALQALAMANGRFSLRTNSPHALSYAQGFIDALETVARMYGLSLDLPGEFGPTESDASLIVVNGSAGSGLRSN